MKIELIEVSRRPQWPLWAVSLISIWLGLGCVSLFIGEYIGKAGPFCVLKRFTGIPCPTCGFTRGGLTFLKGRIFGAWAHNPLLFTFLGLFILATLMRIFFASAVKIRLTRTERIIAWILAVALFFVNWAYVIIYVK